MSAGAFVLVRPALGLNVVVRTISPAAAPIDKLATSLVHADDRAAVGPNLEPKYRICSIKQPDSATLHVTVAETDWQNGAGFLRAARDRRRVPAALHERLLRTMVDETRWLPGLAGVHCLLLTRDRRVVATRRPRTSEFAAGRWSISYEEQVTAADFGAHDDPFSAAARRGFTEEFQLPAQQLRVRIVGAIAEAQILNRVLVALVETEATAEQMEHAGFATLPEIDTITTFDSAPGELRRQALRDDVHPTAPIRLTILADLIPGLGDPP